MPTDSPLIRLPRLTVAALLFGCVGLVALVVALPGTENWVSRDDGNHLYAGQMLQRGVLPYSSIFNYVGSLSQFLCGGAIDVGRKVGIDDVRATRIAFMAIVVAIAAVLVPLGGRISGSSWGCVGASVAVASASPLIFAAAAGPEKYVLVVLFQAFSLAGVLGRRWFLCGAACAAAGLTWQGGWLLLPISATALLDRGSVGRSRALGRLLAGAVLPVVALLVVFATFGSLRDFIDAYVRFNASYAHVGFPGFRAQLLRIAAGLAGSGWAWMAVTVLGLVVVAATALAAPSPEIHRLRPVLLLSVAGYLVMALADFPSLLRLFPLFVPAVVGLALAADWAGRQHNLLLRTCAAGALLLGAGAAVDRSLHMRGNGLSRQLQGVEAIRLRFGERARVIALGAPEFLVLSHAVSPTPYLFFDRGIDRWIEATYPGGFLAWSSYLLTPPPEAIVLGYLEGDLPNRLLAAIEPDYRREQIGPWLLLVRRAPEATANAGSR